VLNDAKLLSSLILVYEASAPLLANDLGQIRIHTCTELTTLRLLITEIIHLIFKHCYFDIFAAERGQDTRSKSPGANPRPRSPPAQHPDTEKIVRTGVGFRKAEKGLREFVKAWPTFSTEWKNKASEMNASPTALAAINPGQSLRHYQRQYKLLEQVRALQEASDRPALLNPLLDTIVVAISECPGSKLKAGVQITTVAHSRPLSGSVDDLLAHIRGLRDLFNFSPDFCAACLEAFQFNYDRTVNAVLEQSLPEPLRSVRDPQNFTDAKAAQLRGAATQQAWPSLTGDSKGGNMAIRVPEEEKIGGLLDQNVQGGADLAFEAYLERTGRISKSRAAEATSKVTELAVSADEKAALHKYLAQAELAYDDEYDDGYDDFIDFDVDEGTEDYGSTRLTFNLFKRTFYVFEYIYI
jgi:hypothetical protein